MPELSIFDTIRKRLAQWLSGAPVSTMSLADPLQEEAERQLRAVAMFRRFYAGEHEIALNVRQRKWLEKRGGETQRLSMNACALVVDTYIERLGLKGVGVMGGTSQRWAQEAEEFLAEIAIPGHVQQELFRTALVDGIAFLHTDLAFAYDTGEYQGVRYQVLRLYVPEEYGGDGEGVVPRYEEGGDQPVSFSVLRREDIPHPETGRLVQATLRVDYGEGYITTWAMFPGDKEWRPWPGERENMLLWGAGEDENFTPIPPPIVAFSLPNARSLLHDIVPLQAVLDNTWLNMAMASDWLGSGLVVFRGFVPTVDGKPLKADRSNMLVMSPGDYLATLQDPSKASVDVVWPANIGQLLDMEDRIVARIAAISGVPVSAFVSTRQVASEGTLKQQEARLLARVRRLQGVFSPAARAWARQALAQAWAFGGYEFAGEWDEYAYVPDWEQAQVRDENDAVQRAIAKVERLGVPLERVWAEELGYTPDEIDEMGRDVFAQALRAEAEARLAQAQSAMALGRG